MFRRLHTYFIINIYNDGSQVPYRVVLLQVICCHLLGVATDLSDQDDAVGLGVPEEDLQTVDEVGSVEGIPPDAWRREEDTA